jgi:uncharacterized membrane protein
MIKNKKISSTLKDARRSAEITLHEATIKGRRAEHYHIRRAAREWIKHIIALVIIAIFVVLIIVVAIINKVT